MKTKALWFFGLAAALAAFAPGGCTVTPGDGTGGDKANAVHLFEGSWKDGSLEKGGEQWFKFTAYSAGVYYIHVVFDTLTGLRARVSYPSGYPVGGEELLREWYDNWSFSREITESGTYYIKVRPYYSYDNGAYRIAYSKSAIPPP